MIMFFLCISHLGTVLQDGILWLYDDVFKFCWPMLLVWLDKNWSQCHMVRLLNFSPCSTCCCTSGNVVSLRWYRLLITSTTSMFPHCWHKAFFSPVNWRIHVARWLAYILHKLGFQGTLPRGQRRLRRHGSWWPVGWHQMQPKLRWCLQVHIT